jgi:hypothetical protein
MPEYQLEPLPYHVELRDYLKSEERDLWNWFSSAKAQADYTENLRMELLKSTYRLDAATHPELFEAAEHVKQQLQLDIPITLYQAQNSSQLNAALYFMPGEGHVVFSGAILSLLNAQEIKSVIGHELAHYHLWQWQGGELHIADRLIQAVAFDPRAAESHENTAHRFQLYTEIFADRGSLCVAGDVHPVIAGLVKIQTGLNQVSAAAYLQQAEEIFSKANVTTEGLSHPEAFIRARALSLWHEQKHDSHPHIARMIEGPAALDRLDLIGQQRMVRSTRRLLEQLLQPKWLQTTAVLGHAKLFFNDFQPSSAADSCALAALRTEDPKTREYFSYVLLDFVTADPELDDMPLAAALDLSRRLEMDAQFERLAAKELKLKVRDIRKLKEQAADMLAKAEAQG